MPKNAPFQEISLQVVFFWHYVSNRGNQMTESSTETRHPGAEGFHARGGQDALGILLAAQIAALRKYRQKR